MKVRRRALLLVLVRALAKLWIQQKAAGKALISSPSESAAPSASPSAGPSYFQALDSVSKFDRVIGSLWLS